MISIAIQPSIFYLILHYLKISTSLLNYALVQMFIHSQSKLAESTSRLEDPVREISALQNMEAHENVIRFIEALHDDRNVYSVSEYCDGGELFDVIKNYGALSEHQGRKCFREILAGLSHIERSSVVHRDLTLENVLLQNGKCKIMDFGMCLLAPRCSVTGLALRMPPQGACGKKNYIAPEVLQNMSPFYGHLVDMWSLGVILFIILTGYPPVEAATALDPRFRMIRDGQLGQLLIEWGVKLGESAVDLMQRMLQMNPNDRLSVDEILNHPWMLAAEADIGIDADMETE